MTRRNVLIAFVALTGLFAVFPNLDLTVSGWFYDPARGFFLADHPLTRIIYKGAQLLAIVLVLAALTILIASFTPFGARLRPHRTAAAFFICLAAIGPGLIVHNVFKDNWGRARPNTVEQFGGDLRYTPPLLPSDQCARNCSFVSGHASVGFGLIALAFAYPRRRRRWIGIALAGGLLIGLGRIVQGRHFLSDILFCGLIVSATFVALEYLFGKLADSSATPARTHLLPGQDAEAPRIPDSQPESHA